MPKTNARFFDLARLKQQLDADSEVPLRELRERDSNIGKHIHAEGASARASEAKGSVAKLLYWLDLIEGNRQHPRGHQESFIVFFLCLAGLLGGVLSMTGVLFANSQQPVNVLLFLALFVGLQLLLLIVSLASAFMPIQESALRSPLALLNPAKFALKRALRYLSTGMPWDKIPRLGRFAILRWGQILGLAFNFSLLATMLAALLISDRSFGWSSTLNISAASLKTLLEFLAAPWSWLSDSPSISPELIANTRFQSLQTQFGSSQVEAMRHWWPFLFTCIAVYGLLPRLLLLIAFQFLYSRTLQRTILSYPGVALVLERLDLPLVNTHTGEPDQHIAPNKEELTPSSVPRQQDTWLLNWAGALKEGSESRLQSLGIHPSTIINAGLQLQNDNKIIETINQQKPAALIIAVKSWEPPLAELIDFISAIEFDTNFYFLLIPLQHRAVSKDELADWQYFIQEKMQVSAQLLRADDPGNECR